MFGCVSHEAHLKVAGGKKTNPLKQLFKTNEGSARLDHLWMIYNRRTRVQTNWFDSDCCVFWMPSSAPRLLSGLGQ